MMQIKFDLNAFALRALRQLNTYGEVAGFVVLNVEDAEVGPVLREISGKVTGLDVNAMAEEISAPAVIADAKARTKKRVAKEAKAKRKRRPRAPDPGGRPSVNDIILRALAKGPLNGRQIKDAIAAAGWSENTGSANIYQLKNTHKIRSTKEGYMLNESGRKQLEHVNGTPAA